jgi:hypothetical protein
MSDQRDTWTPGIESILEEIRQNSMTISEYHKDRYYHQKGHLKYFRIPTIIFSAMNSVFSVGLQPYCAQQLISVLCCLISMVCGIISSIELFLSIQTTMENELIASKEFYLLSVDIFKMLYLERETRMINGKTYLDETYQTYCKLIENTNLVKKNMKNMISLPHTLPHTLPPIPVPNKQITNTEMIETVTKFNNEANDIEKKLTKDLIPNFTALESKMEEHLEDFSEEKEEKEELKEEQVILSDTIVKPKRKYTKKSDKMNI